MRWGFLYHILCFLNRFFHPLPEEDHQYYLHRKRPQQKRKVIMKKHLLIVATLDTKGREAAYIKGDVQRLGIQPILMDVGILGEPLTPPDINRKEGT